MPWVQNCTAESHDILFADTFEAFTAMITAAKGSET